MKKILIAILFILLCIMLYFACFKGISIGKIKIDSIKSIESMSLSLDEKKNEATEKTNKAYPESLSRLKESINSLNIARNKYNDKVKYMGEDSSINTVQIEKYKIEFLWTRLGNYANEHQVKMQMNLVEAGVDTYNLDFNIIGSYINVTDFIYDIENDAELNFKISDFKLLQDNTATTTTIVTQDGSIKDVNDPYSSQISITQEEKTVSTIIDNEETEDVEETEQTEEEGEEAEEENTSSSTTNSSNTKIIYGPKRLEASFKIYGVEINFN